MPTLTEEAKIFLESLGVSARKKLGQNFMVREAETAYIADLILVDKDVLEIGPGLGFLTRRLLEKNAKVLAVEKDKAYVKFLNKYFQDQPLKVIEHDVLEVDLKKDLKIEKPIQVVGNIPFNITTPILEWMVRQKRYITKAVLTVQLEVAQRLAAGPGTKSWGSLSVFLQMNADVIFKKKIGRESFYPSPRVDSAVIEIRFLDKPRFEVKDEERFFEIVRIAFQKRRKTLLNALSGGKPPHLTKASLADAFQNARIDAKRRPETLTLEEWARFYKFVA